MIREVEFHPQLSLTNHTPLDLFVQFFVPTYQGYHSVQSSQCPRGHTVHTQALSLEKPVIIQFTLESRSPQE